MTSKQRRDRISQIIRVLSAMSRQGWQGYTYRDWEPLEVELRRLTLKP